MKRIISKLRCRKGQAIVEMALVLPILLMLLFGIVEFGRIFNTYLIVSNASREGARLAALRAVDDSTVIENEVKDFIVSTGLCKIGEVDGKVTVTTLEEGVSYLKENRKSGERILVEVQYNLNLITPIIGPIISESGNIDIEAYTQMRVE